MDDNNKGQGDPQNSPNDSQNENSNENKDTDKEQHFDFKKELEEVKERQIRQGDAIGHIRGDIKELKDREPEEIDKENIQETIQKTIQKEMSSFRTEVNRGRIENEIIQLTKNPDEINLIKFHLENSVLSSGDISTDVKRAWLLANEKRFSNREAELQKILNSKEGKETPGGAGQKKNKPQGPQLSDADNRIIQQLGMKWNPETKRFENQEQWFSIDPNTGESTSGRL